MSQVEIINISSGYANLVMQGDCKLQTYTVGINCNIRVYAVYIYMVIKLWNAKKVP